MKRNHLLTAAAILGMSFCATEALAQATESGPTGLGDVVVTARRQQEKLQSVPVAVSVLNQKELSKNGSFTPFSLQEVVPNFHIVNGTSGTDSLYITIRGQVQQTQTALPTVIPYYAEVPQLHGFASGQFFDLENVQVLRGPQGVRFGRVTDGGALLLSPKKPGEDFGGYIQGKLGDYSMHGLEGALNIPIVTDKVLFRAAFDVMKRDGYTENLVTGRNLDDVNYATERLSLIVRPFDGLENYTTAQYQEINQTGLAQAPAWLTPGSAASFFGYDAALAAQLARGPRIVANGCLCYGPNGGMADKKQTLFVSNITTYDLNENLSFKNIIGYSTFNQRQQVDDDATAITLIDLPSRYLPVSQNRQLSEEFQINGKLFDRRLNWTLGFFTDQQKPTRKQGTDYIIFVGSEQASVAYITTTSKAVYGSFEYDLRDFVQGLKINGGMRYTEDRAAGDTVTYFVPLALAGQVPYGVCTSFQGATCLHSVQESNATTWEAGATYQATNNLFFYASGRRGYRGGGINRATSIPNLRAYNPEYTTGVEVGAKADWTLAGMQARTNIAFFHDKLKAMQKNVNFVIGGTSVGYITNASGATVQGAEFEGKLVPFNGLTLALNYAFTDAQYDRDPSQNAALFDPVVGACSYFATGFPAVGAPGFCPYNEFAHTPKHSASFSAEYELPLAESVGSVRFGGDYNYQSKTVGEDQNFGSPTRYQKAYATLNLHVAWDNVYGRPVDLNFFMTNVTDELYRNGSAELAKLNSLGYNYYSYAEPRMYGFSLKYRFGTDS